MKTKIFDTATLAGIRRAEAFKRKMENEFDKVAVIPIGLDRVQITGRNR
jgi:hypothetical protein